MLTVKNEYIEILYESIYLVLVNYLLFVFCFSLSPGTKLILTDAVKQLMSNWKHWPLYNLLNTLEKI